jgi:hypothetical protein
VLAIRGQMLGAQVHLDEISSVVTELEHPLDEPADQPAERDEADPGDAHAPEGSR